LNWPQDGIVREQIEGVDLLIYEDRPRSIPQMFYNSALAQPDRTALICDDIRWSYKELEARVNLAALTLKQKWGIQKGDRVAVMLGNCPEFVILYLGITIIGGIFVPLNTRLKSREFSYQIQKATPKLVFVSEDFWTEIEPIKQDLRSVEKFFSVGGDITGTEPFEVLFTDSSTERIFIENLNENDLGCILFTSGTTGHPKGVMLTHCNVVNTAIACARVFNATVDDVDLIMVPLFHVTGLFTQLSQTLYLGGTSVLMRTFKADAAMAIIEKEHATLSISVPTIYWLMLVSPSFSKYRLDSFSKIVYGGAPAAPELVQQLAEAFPGASLINAGGLTEGTSLQYALPPDVALRKAGSVGLPTPCTEYRLADEQGVDVPNGEVGELILKGAGIAKGYWEDMDNTKRAFKDGWLYTGDLAKADDEGYLWFMDRKKDMIIRGGENIYSVEVENVLYAFPKTLEAAVVGVPDKIFGEQVKAYVVLKEGQTASEEEIRNYCAKHLADYKVPKYILFLNEPLPRNPGGKVKKEVLRALQLTR